MARWWLALCVVACGGTPARVPPPIEVAMPPPPELTPEPIAAPLSPPLPAELAAEPACAASPRDARQKPQHVIELLALSPAMTVVDVGAGSGYFMCWLSRAVGPRGRVIETEVVAGLVSDLEERAARDELSNVEVVRAPMDDVGVPPGTADRIVVAHVWHHIANRARYAARIARALAPGGKLVVIDFPPNRGGHGIAPGRVLAELAAGGLTAALVPEALDDDYAIVASVREQ